MHSDNNACFCSLRQEERCRERQGRLCAAEHQLRVISTLHAGLLRFQHGVATIHSLDHEMIGDLMMENSGLFNVS